MFKFNNSKQNNKGFTLIEVMISTGLFAVIMTLGVGAVLNTNVAYKKNQDQRAVMDSLAFIVEDMARLIRTGSNFNCIQSGENFFVANPADEAPESCLLGSGITFPQKGLSFEKTGGTTQDPTDQIVYAFYSDGLYRSDIGGASLDTSNPEFRLTPKNVKFNIDESGFLVRGADSGFSDGQQPIVFIRFVGEIENIKEGFSTPFSYQIAITQRRIDS